MKTEENNNKKMTAIEFLRSYEETQKIMENIADDTAKEQTALTESIGKTDYTNDDGIFLMENLLDVEVSDGEDMQPRYYNSPVDELSDSDKALIVDEFTKMISDMHEEVIDFSDIGPVATVIQDRFGFKQDVEGFLRNTIEKAVDWQQSQQYAHDNVAAGEEIATEAPVEPEGMEAEKSPTDIEPEQSGLDADGVGLSPEEVPMEEPIAVEEPLAVEVPVEEELITEEVPVEELAEEVAEEVTEELAEEAAEEVTEEVAEEVAEEDAEDEEFPELPAFESEEETVNVDVQLESIKSAFLGKKQQIDSLVESAAAELEKETTINAQLESIKNDILSSQKVLVESTEDDEADMEDEAAMEDEDVKTESDAKLEAQLEAIAKDFHATENAKVEAIEKDKQITAQLESIATDYHKAEKAKVEAIQKEKEVDSKLNSLVESYQASQKANLEARKEAKAKLEELDK